MSDFIISVDSSACFSAEQLKKYGILMAHLSYTLDGKVFKDKFDNDEQKQEFYDKLSAGHKAQSSKVNPSTYYEVWEQTLKNGIDILHLSLSGKVSGSYESACQAAKELYEKYARKIEVVDTKTGSFAITALALDLLDIKKGATIEQAKEFVLNVLADYNLVFTVGDIKHLYRGGRISHMQALVGGLLNLKPVLYISEKGKLELVTNARGRRKALSILVEKMQKNFSKLTDSAAIAHGGDISAAEELKNKLINVFPKLKEIKIDYLTPVLGLHAGPGSLILCFKGKKRDLLIKEANF